MNCPGCVKCFDKSGFLAVKADEGCDGSGWIGPPFWSTEPPTEPGWYYCHIPESLVWFPVSPEKLLEWRAMGVDTTSWRFGPRIPDPPEASEENGGGG